MVFLLVVWLVLASLVHKPYLVETYKQSKKYNVSINYLMSDLSNYSLAFVNQGNKAKNTYRFEDC